MGIKNTSLNAILGRKSVGLAWLSLSLLCFSSCSGDSQSAATQDAGAQDVSTADVENTDITAVDIENAEDVGTGSDTASGLPNDASGHSEHDSAPEVTTIPWSFPTEVKSETLWEETLLTTATTWVAALGDSRVLALSEGLLWELTPAGNREIALPENFDTESLQTAIRTDAGTTIVLCTTAIYVVQDDSLVLSPITDSLSGATLIDMTRTEDDTLWFASSDGLYRWGDGILNLLDLGDLPSKNAFLSYGGSEKGFLWVATENHVYAIEESESGFQAWPASDELQAFQIASELSGGLWIRTETALYRLHHDGTLDLAETAFAVERIWGVPEVASLWIRSNKGALYRWEEDSLWLAENVAESADCAAEKDGSLLMASESGLKRVKPGRSIAITNINNGDTLLAAQDIEFEIAFADVVDTVTAEINGSPVAVQEDPYRIFIDVETLGDGVHSLSITASYNDGFPASFAEITFVIEQPTTGWADEISLISESECGQCHGEGGFVQLKLFKKQQWVDNINDIIEALETNLMPPGESLNGADIEVIKLWRDLEFPD